MFSILLAKRFFGSMALAHLPINFYNHKFLDIWYG